MSYWRPAIRWLSPGGKRGKLLVFIFHRILATSDPLLPGEPDSVQFEWMARFISRNFTVLPFGHAVELLNCGRLPPAAACITFDDGYQDNFSVALPILRRHGLVATFFIATGFLGGGRMWNDDIIEAVRVLPSVVVDWSEFGLGQYDLTTHRGRLSAIDAALGRLKYFPHGERQVAARAIARRSGVVDESKLMMSADEVRAIRDAGMELGGHTHSHPILRSLDDAQAYAEIIGGKVELEAILGGSVDVFAYPNGDPERDLTSRHAEMVRAAGFRAAATTAWGVGRLATDPFLLPRFTPWDRTYNRFAARCALTLAESR